METHEKTIDSSIILVSREVLHLTALMAIFYSGNGFRKAIYPAGLASISKGHADIYCDKHHWCMWRRPGNKTQTAICRLHMQLS